MNKNKGFIEFQKENAARYDEMALTRTAVKLIPVGLVMFVISVLWTLGAF